MHIHILGICGTFMAGIALIARELGHHVSGSDANVYPPMSTQLAEAGIQLMSGYQPEHLQPAPDQVIVGNAVSRGNPAVEYMLRHRLRYTSGPQWLAEQVLQPRWVLAVAGTHGKTTSSSMLAWILEYAGQQPGFLIGGIPDNFGVSARLGKSEFFVIEADEYDTAFFDKRSKFVHYHPRTLVMNNLEFDHADIFPDITAIQQQFHHLVRTIPDNGLIIRPVEDIHLQEVLDLGCWTPLESMTLNNSAANWQVVNSEPDGSVFDVLYSNKLAGRINWALTGQHNIQNALAALAAANHIGISPHQAIEALCNFQGVKRRMELRGEVRQIKVYDDFAHHPTAIATTLQGLRASVGNKRILAILEPRSNTMQMGIHADQLATALQPADQVYLYTPPDLAWQPEQVMGNAHPALRTFNDIAALVSAVVKSAQPQDTIIVMSNGGFDDIHSRLLRSLEKTS